MVKFDLNKKKEKVEEFVKHGLWEPRQTGWRRHAYSLIRYALMIDRHFQEDNGFVRAGALSYTSVLSIIPVLAVLFAMIGSFAPFRRYENQIMDFVLTQIMPPVQTGEPSSQVREDIGKRIKQFLQEKQESLREASTAIGAVGVGFLVLTVISLMVTIEKAFNTIWHVTRGRTVVQRIVYYWSLTIVPVFVVISLAAAASLSSSTIVQRLRTVPVIRHIIEHALTGWLAGVIVPLLLVWVAFTALYLYLPNTSVRLKAAAVGGIFAAVMFELAKWASFAFNARFIRYSALYGAIAAVPIMLVWLYFVWVIVLVGAEVSYAFQNMKSYSREERLPTVSQSVRERVAIRVLALICKRFYMSETPPSLVELSDTFDLSPRFVSDILHAMSTCGIVTEMHNGDIRYQPGRALEKITVKTVIDCLRRRGVEPRGELAPEEKVVIDLFNRGEAAADEIYAATTFTEIAQQMSRDIAAGKT